MLSRRLRAGTDLAKDGVALVDVRPQLQLEVIELVPVALLQLVQRQTCRLQTCTRQWRHESRPRRRQWSPCQPVRAHQVHPAHIVPSTVHSSVWHLQAAELSLCCRQLLSQLICAYPARTEDVSANFASETEQLVNTETAVLGGSAPLSFLLLLSGSQLPPELLVRHRSLLRR